PLALMNGKTAIDSICVEFDERRVKDQILSAMAASTTTEIATRTLRLCCLISVKIYSALETGRVLMLSAAIDLDASPDSTAAPPVRYEPAPSRGRLNRSNLAANSISCFSALRSRSMSLI